MGNRCSHPARFSLKSEESQLRRFKTAPGFTDSKLALARKLRARQNRSKSSLASIEKGSVDDGPMFSKANNVSIRFVNDQEPKASGLFEKLKALRKKKRKNASDKENLDGKQQPLDSAVESHECQLLKDQRKTMTAFNKKVNDTIVRKMMNQAMLEKMRNNPLLSPDVELIIRPPFSNLDQIVNGVFQTGIGGLIKENFENCKIRLIINATYEMPLINTNDVVSCRIPVDDSPNEDMSIYFDDVCDLIETNRLQGYGTVIHCMAGVSRSSTIMLAYLVKYTNLTLYQSFLHLKTIRDPVHPNVNFMQQLLTFELKLRNVNSFKIIEQKIDCQTVTVPDFYEKLYPKLYEAEINRQTRDTSKNNLNEEK